MGLRRISGGHATRVTARPGRSRGLRPGSRRDHEPRRRLFRLYARGVDLGAPISYEVLSRGTPIYSADGVPIGAVVHVLAAEDEDVFDGIVIGGHPFGTQHRFADADEIDGIFERGVVLKLDRSGCEQLPEPSANPAVMRDDPAQSRADIRREKLRRAWDLISGNY